MQYRNLVALPALLCSAVTWAQDIVLPPADAGAALRGANTQSVVFDVPLTDLGHFNEYFAPDGITDSNRIEVPVSVPQFDGTLGQLVAVNITLNAQLYAEIGVEAEGILNTGTVHQAVFESLDVLFGNTRGYPAVGLLQTPSNQTNRRIAPAFYPIGSLGVGCFGVPGDEDACNDFDSVDAQGDTTIDLFIFETPDGPIYDINDWIGEGTVPNLTVFIDNPGQGVDGPQFAFTLDNVGGALGNIYTEFYGAWINIEYVYEVDAPDSDGDGIADAADNCLSAANPAQRDTDADGLGNICDADLNQDCIVNVVDLGQLRAVFFTGDANADLNGDGTVNVQDLGLMRAQFFAAPGPSGIPNFCQP